MKATFKKKLLIIVIMLVSAAFCVGYVALNAYSSQLQYDINKLSSETTEIEYKIANLEVKIQSASNITNLEERALALGMIHPGFDRILSINSAEETITDFAAAIKQNAYN